MARKDKIIYLIKKTNPKPNSIGDMVSEDIKIKRFAEEESIRQSEFYRANSQGLKPQITFVIHPKEYDGQETLEFGGNRYKIIRTYKKSSTKIQLICEGDKHGNS
ncbi:MAG: phage head closure protein [Clostridium sp.]